MTLTCRFLCKEAKRRNADAPRHQQQFLRFRRDRKAVSQRAEQVDIITRLTL